MSTAIATLDNRLSEVVHLVTDALDSQHSKRAYTRALNDFLTWHTTQNTKGLSRAGVNAYREFLRTSGVSDSSVNQRLSAVRKFVSEAADNGLIDYQTATAIKGVKGIATRGQHLGNWLDKDAVTTMLRSPDLDSLRGKRDRAILAILIGAGLRREEVVNLDVSHIQQRAGRWVIVDLVGKRNKVRSVPIAPWVYVDVERWMNAAGITEGPLFRPIRKGGHLQAGRLTSQAVWNVVTDHSPYRNPIAPHDLRRTFAKLARAGGASLEQIQLVLGHESIATTERYLGADLDLRQSPSDLLGLDHL